MFFNDLELINEQFNCDFARPDQMDALWEQGWRHFGNHFFRYNLGFHNDEIQCVLPLRSRLAHFTFSKSQRRNLRRNTSLRTKIGPLNLTPEAERLFVRHKIRFREGVPESLGNFVPRRAADSPADTMQLSVFDGERLVAESYFDAGATALSGIYAMFDPEMAKYGLGVFTLLKEIEFAIDAKKELYYLGYAYEGASFYDYKKRFRATEAFDWADTWYPVAANTA